MSWRMIFEFPDGTRDEDAVPFATREEAARRMEWWAMKFSNDPDASTTPCEHDGRPALVLRGEVSGHWGWIYIEEIAPAQSQEARV